MMITTSQDYSKDQLKCHMGEMMSYGGNDVIWGKLCHMGEMMSYVGNDKQ